MLTPFARPREQHSLFGEILDWLLAPLLVLWPLSIASIWLVAQGIANGPFDRELGEKVRVLSKHVSVTTTPSGVTLAQFSAVAKPVTVDVGGSIVVAFPKTFSTGSYGWGAQGKVTLMVDGMPVVCQVGLNITVIGSKPVAAA